MRLIDADAFSTFIKKAVREHGYEVLRIPDTLTVENVLNLVCAELDGTALEGFKNAPTVDAVPVVHGRWIVHYGNWADVYECDQCRHESKEGGKYCSNCGARMDGKQL